MAVVDLRGKAVLVTGEARGGQVPITDVLEAEGAGTAAELVVDGGWTAGLTVKHLTGQEHLAPRPPAPTPLGRPPGPRPSPEAPGGAEAEHSRP
nr:hypothetical protein OG409_25400 [Streptomyces sp. NBC_00974]